MANWNGITTGLVSGLSSTVEGYLQGQKQRALHDLYLTTAEQLNKSFQPDNVKQPDTYDANGQLQSIGQYTPDPNSVDPKESLSTLYKGVNDLLPYGEDAKPYIGMLQGLYQNQLPDYQFMQAGDNIVRIDKSDGSAKEIYKNADQKLQRDVGIPTRVYEKDGQYFFKQAFNDKTGNTQWKETPATEEDYIDQLATDKTKGMSWQDKEDYKQNLKIAFKMDFPSFGNKKGGKEPSLENLGADELKKNITDFNKLIDAKNNSTLSDADKKKYDRLSNEIRTTTGQDPESVVKDITSKTFNTKNYKVQMQDYIKKRQADVQAQWDTFQKAYKDAQAKLQNGEWDLGKFKDYLMSQYKANMGNMYPDLQKQIEKWASGFGIDLSK